jgi:6-phosphogluconolactonase
MSSRLSAAAAQPLFCGFRNAEDMYDVLAREIAERLATGIARRGAASLVLSGGTTPGPLFDVLNRQDIAWNKVSVTLSDERWTEPTSERSNEYLARRHFLNGKAAASRFIPLKTDAETARAAQIPVNAAIGAMPRPFDVVLLGMGTDGHIASLIPSSRGLGEAMESAHPALAGAIDPPDLAAMGERMTLTLRALLDARWIVLLIRGEAKLAAYKWAQGGSDLLEAPVRGVLHQTAVPVSVFWSD